MVQEKINPDVRATSTGWPQVRPLSCERTMKLAPSGSRLDWAAQCQEYIAIVQFNGTLRAEGALVGGNAHRNRQLPGKTITSRCSIYKCTTVGAGVGIGVLLPIGFTGGRSPLASRYIAVIKMTWPSRCQRFLASSSGYQRKRH